MNSYNTNRTEDPKVGRTILDDIRRGDFKSTIKTDYHELKEFFLDEHRRERLKEMSRIKTILCYVDLVIKKFIF